MQFEFKRNKYLSSEFFCQTFCYYFLCKRYFQKWLFLTWIWIRSDFFKNLTIKYCNKILLVNILKTFKMLKMTMFQGWSNIIFTFEIASNILSKWCIICNKVKIKFSVSCIISSSHQNLLKSNTEKKRTTLWNLNVCYLAKFTLHTQIKSYS